MTTVLRTLGAIWLAPATIVVWVCYLLPFWALGLIRYDGSPRLPVARFKISERFSKIWEGWGGHAMPHAIVVKQYPEGSQGVDELERHELRHTDQWLWLGVLFPFVYLILLAFYGYQGHPLEKDARTHAASTAP